MEKRAILALVLCGAVLLIHMFVIQPLLTPPDKEDQGAGGESTPGTGDVQPAEDPTRTVKKPPRVKVDPITVDPITVDPAVTPDKTEKPVEITLGTDDTQPRTVKPIPPGKAEYVAADAKVPKATFELESEQFSTVWTNEFSGALLDVTSNKYFVTVKHEERLGLLGAGQKVVLPNEDERPARALSIEIPDMAGVLANMKMVCKKTDGGLEFTGSIFRLDTASGTYKPYLKVVKTVRLSADKPEIEMDVKITNLSVGDISKMKYSVVAGEGVCLDERWSQPSTVRIATRAPEGVPDVETRSASDIEKDKPWQKGSGGVLWAGMDHRYFAIVLFAARDEDGKPRVLQSATVEHLKIRPTENAPDPMDLARVKISTKPDLLSKGATSSASFRLFVGPKERNTLEGYADLGLTELINLGKYLGSISELLLWLLRTIQSVVSNWGVAIILMTCIIRAILHPITKKGQVQAQKMQKLQPLVKELQKKYKDDKQKLAQEQMKLFKDHGASPFGGCLPLLIQLPILIALFSALRSAFELRQEPFIFWIKDLSLPDSIGTFPAGAAWLAGVSINILPLVMTASMLIQQRMMPKSDDPQAKQQRTIMTFMSVFFLYILYSFPSGLCLYWTCSTIIGIVEAHFVRKHIEALPEVGSPGGKKK